MSESLNFHPNVFQDPRSYEETPLRDRKRDFPELENDRGKARFIERIIALANTARLFGKPAYFLYGLDDVGHIYGLESSISRYGDLEDVKTWEKVRRSIKEQVCEYVTPLMHSWHFEHGDVGGQKVAYLLIEPVSYGPFQVGRPIAHLHPGERWIRVGESKQPVAPAEDKFWYAYSEVPFVLPSAWEQYFEGLLSNPYLNLTAACQVEAYQDLFITTGALLKQEVALFLDDPEERLLVVRGSAGSGKSTFLRRLVAKWAGAGKTAVEGALAREEFHPPPQWIPIYYSLRGKDIAANWQLESALPDELNRSSQSAFWERERPSEPEKLLEYPELHWLVCLDGLDEIWTREQRVRFVSKLIGFLTRYPRVKVVLTTRPDIEVTLGEGKIAEICPFPESKILSYIQAFVAEPEQYSEVLNKLQSEPDLWYLCGIPAYLEAAMREMADIYPAHLEEPVQQDMVRNVDMLSSPITPPEMQTATDTELTEIPRIPTEELVGEENLSEASAESGSQNKQHEDTTEMEEMRSIEIGILLDSIYRHLWELEMRRHPILAQQEAEWWNDTGELATKMDGHRRSIRYKEATAALPGEEAVNGLLGLGILIRRSSRSWLRFATDLTQQYFSAIFLKSFLDEQVYADACSFVSQMQAGFRQSVLKILGQITSRNLVSYLEGGQR